MSKLDRMLAMQSALQARLGYDVDNMTVEERSKYIQKQAQHMTHELHEMLQELPFFKEWKKYPDSPEDLEHMLDEARLEWIDVLHFFINITLALDFTGPELFARYASKNAVNHARQQDTDRYKPCVEEE